LGLKAGKASKPAFKPCKNHEKPAQDCGTAKAGLARPSKAKLCKKLAFYFLMRVQLKVEDRVLAVLALWSETRRQLARVFLITEDRRQRPRQRPL
jgi:hypothetical protein